MTVGLLMVDLDGFKSINDRFGHVAGDMVIRDISRSCGDQFASSMCTRFGGEEFAVMMPGGTAESRARSPNGFANVLRPINAANPIWSDCGSRPALASPCRHPV